MLELAAEGVMARPMRVIIESPLGRRPDGTRIAPGSPECEANLAYARAAMLDSLRRGEAPYGSHLLYPQCLDDATEAEREMGITAGFAWGEVAELVAVYVDRGVTPGMLRGIERAQRAGQRVEARTLLQPETARDPNTTPPDPVKEYRKKLSEEWPARRNRLDQMTPAELAIVNAIGAVEALPPDPRLTDAVVLLCKAQDRVADFVDGAPEREALRPPPPPLSHAHARADDEERCWCGHADCEVHPRSGLGQAP